MTEGVEITSSMGVIATGPADAARVGARIFELGGNAADATAAAALACAVLEPQAVDLGGYVLAAAVMEGTSGKVWSLDANAVAPAASREDMYKILPVRESTPGINELEYQCSVEGDANVYGPLSVAVPGFMGGVGTLWQRWGSLPWRQIVAPALQLLAEGVDYALVSSAADFKRAVINGFPSTAAILPEGATGRWKREDLVRTLNRLAEAGWRDFYEGEIGHCIADFVAEQGGVLTREDMASFTPRISDAYEGSYLDARLYTAIPPNGGYSVLEAMRDLERSGLPAESDARYWLEIAGVLRRMWSRRLGVMPPATSSPYGTIHIASADRAGNLASATISQGGLFGSCLAVPGTGIILAHGMCRFDPRPGLENSPGGKKRPLNNVCPMIIRMPGRDVALGARGGRRIVSVAVQLVERVVRQGATVRDAATRPRIHTITGDPVEISADFESHVRDSLAQAGHHLTVPNEVAGAAHGAEILSGGNILRGGGNTWAVGV